MNYRSLKSINKYKLLLISGFVLFFCLGIVIFNQVKQKSAVGAGNAKNKQTTVDVLTVKRGNLIKNISLTGQTVPKSQVDIAAKYLGKVVAVKVDLGQSVSEGQILIVQDTKDIDNSIQQNQAAYQQAAADAVTTEVSVNANYSKAQADYQRALDSYQRYKMLYAAGGISKEQLDTNSQQLTAAKTALDILANQMNSGTAASVTSAQAAAAKAQYSVNAMQTQRDDLILRAPCSGVIGYRQVEVGSMVTAGQKLLSIVDNSEIYVDCQVAPEDLPALKAGMNVEVQLDALGKTLPGKVIYISPASDSQTQTFSLRIALDNPGPEVKGGIFAQANIASVLRKNTLAVPKEAVLEKSGETYVYVIDSQNKVEKRVVQVGVSGDQNVEILSGLTEGEQIAVSNLSRLASGMVINRGGNQ
ncbi:rnd efflux pump membrane fusion protein [Lucifera butyrica]|uniref:Rnd efflux pump membrane fusion protein n=1 Tax=Lucifera butyrica TaxID=1351585 RepID=A0A498RBF2_9FIRM|nr:efflux RND transporter periplasmic adaptor subunit [Lucifera butyrica]VBB08270.1 rnd efflux pump membrane fusion protein [Lucifera butyrica]